MTNRPQYTSFEYLSRSVQYFNTAKLITETAEFRANSRAYLAPTLQLLGQGIELLIKASLKADGKSEKEFHGHCIVSLWQQWPDAYLKEEIFKTAERLDKGHSFENNVPPAENPRSFFMEMIERLSDVYTSDGSQLRYPAPTGTKAPRAGWLVETFHEVVAFKYVNHPEYIASENSDHT